MRVVLVGLEGCSICDVAFATLDYAICLQGI